MALKGKNTLIRVKEREMTESLHVIKGRGGGTLQKFMQSTRINTMLQLRKNHI